MGNTSPYASGWAPLDEFIASQAPLSNPGTDTQSNLTTDDSALHPRQDTNSGQTRPAASSADGHCRKRMKGENGPHIHTLQAVHHAPGTPACNETPAVLADTLQRRHH